MGFVSSLLASDDGSRDQGGSRRSRFRGGLRGGGSPGGARKLARLGFVALALLALIFTFSGSLRSLAISSAAEAAARRVESGDAAVAAGGALASPSGGGVPAAASGPPKVALLFLTRGPIPLEPAWRQFFVTAGEITTAADLAAEVGGADASRQAADAATRASDVRKAREEALAGARTGPKDDAGTVPPGRLASPTPRGVVSLADDGEVTAGSAGDATRGAGSQRGGARELEGYDDGGVGSTGAGGLLGRVARKLIDTQNVQSFQAVLQATGSNLANIAKAPAAAITSLFEVAMNGERLNATSLEYSQVTDDQLSRSVTSSAESAVQLAEPGALSSSGGRRRLLQGDAQPGPSAFGFNRGITASGKAGASGDAAGARGGEAYAWADADAAWEEATVGQEEQGEEGWSRQVLWALSALGGKSPPSDGATSAQGIPRSFLRTGDGQGATTRQAVTKTAAAWGLSVGLEARSAPRPPTATAGGKTRTLFRLPSRPEQRANVHLALRIDDHNERAWGRLEAPVSALSEVDIEGPISRQSLFSVYVHTTPSFAFLPGSLFAGRQIRDRVYVRWGQWSVAEAERRLMRAALADPRNNAFALLSESCAPLLPPHAVHAQLLWEAKSRVSSCAGPGQSLDRWQEGLAARGKIDSSHWRKSSQWLSLTREHARLVASDEDVWPSFEEHCYSYVPGTIHVPPYIAARGQGNWTLGRNCVPDEHYIPTLLAVRGASSGSACDAHLTHTAWPEGSWSPKIYDAEQVATELMTSSRWRVDGRGSCDFRGLLESSKALYARRGSSRTLDGAAIDSRAAPLRPHDARLRGAPADCPLFARKINGDGAGALVALGRDCVDGTAIDASCLPAASL